MEIRQNLASVRRIVLAAVCMTLITLALMSYVLRLGKHIPQSNLSLDYLVALVWWSLLAFSIAFWPVSNADKPTLLALWGTRLFVTLFAMLFYENQYIRLDSYRYFQEATATIRYTRNTSHGSGNIDQLLSLIEQCFPTSFHAAKVSFSMIGLIGVYFFYRAAVKFIGHEDRRILLVLGLTPSIAFWGSILGKDPVVMAGVGVYAYGVTALCRKPSWSALLCLILGITIAAEIRLWMAAIMVAPLVIVAWGFVSNPVARGVLLLAIVLGFLTALGPMMMFFKAASAEALIEAISTTGESSFSKGGSSQQVAAITGWGSFIKFAPWGAFSALFRPLPGEVNNPFGVLAGLEDAILLGFAVRAVIRTRIDKLGDTVVLWDLGFIGLWAVLYGLISTHNLGAGVRYRTQILPCVILIVLYLGQPLYVPKVDSASLQIE